MKLRIALPLLTLLCLSLLSQLALAEPTNLVVNGGFETGDFTGWTLSGDTQAASVVNDPMVAHSGCCYAAFNPPAGQFTSISQTLTTVPGQAYDLRFFERTFPGGGDPLVIIVVVDDIIRDPFPPRPVDSWWPPDCPVCLRPFVALTEQTELTILVESFGTGSPTTLGFDDISVQAVPESSSILLFGSGIFGLASVMRRKLNL